MLLCFVRELITFCPTPAGEGTPILISSENGKFERLAIRMTKSFWQSNVHMTPHDMASSIRYYGSDLVQLPPSVNAFLSSCELRFPCGAMLPLFTPVPASHNSHALWAVVSKTSRKLNGNSSRASSFWPMWASTLVELLLPSWPRVLPSFLRKART